MMNHLEIQALNWKQMNGLLPAVIQNVENGQVLMLGYMNQEALIATVTSGQLNLYSRSQKRLWRQGETSGDTMSVEHMSIDCDNKSLLVQVLPKGPACHLGPSSCYQPLHNSKLGFLDELIGFINEASDRDNEMASYTAGLLASGVDQCAQKLGQESTEVVIAAVNKDSEKLINKSAGLIFHLFLLLKAFELSLYDVLSCLQKLSLYTQDT